MKTNLSILVLVFICLSLHAQDKVKLFSVQDVYMHVGSFTERLTYTSLNDFQKLAPNSQLLNADLSGYDENRYFNYSGRSNFSVLVGMHLRDKEGTGYRKNTQIRIGFNYMDGDLLNKNYNKDESYPYDTLTSSQTNQVFYVDSTVNRSYSLAYYSEQLRLDASVIWQSNNEARWCFIMGLGFNAGFSFNGYTNISYEEIHRADFSNSYSYNQGYYFESSNEQVSENFKNKGAGTFSLFMPLAIDFRLGKKNELLKHLHLYYELRPTFSYSGVSNLEYSYKKGFLVAFGLRYSR